MSAPVEREQSRPSTPQEAGAPLASLVDKLLDNVLWSDSDPEWLERALPAVVELIEPDLLPVLEANLDYWQRRAETAEAALASREAEVRRKVAGEIRAHFATVETARGFVERYQIGMDCGPGSAAYAIAAEIERSRS